MSIEIKEAMTNKAENNHFHTEQTLTTPEQVFSGHLVWNVTAHFIL